MTSFFKRSFLFPVWYYCKATSSPEISLDFSGISGYCKYPRDIPEYRRVSTSLLNSYDLFECCKQYGLAHWSTIGVHWQECTKPSWFHTRPQCGMLLAEVTQPSSWAQHWLISRHCSSPIPKHLCTSTGGLLRSQQSAFSILHSECPE